MLTEQKKTKCELCENFNTVPNWCLTCDPDFLIQIWTSGNKKIDDIIKQFQLRTDLISSARMVQWISFDRLTDIKEIGKGGFSSISSAYWSYELSLRKEGFPVALKSLPSYDGNFNFLKEVS